MKKTILMSICAAAAAMFVTGCTSISTSDGAQGVVQPSTVNYGYKAEFQHKDIRVQGEAEINVLFGLFAWGANGFADNSDLTAFSFFPSPSNFAKSAAVYEACRANKADTLFGTRYKVTTTDYFVYKVVKCNVAGFPATMIGVKKLEPYVLRGKETDMLVYLDAAPKVVK